MKTFIVERGTHGSEIFDPITLHQSIVNACASVRALEGEAHLIAQRVCQHVIDWLIDKTEVTNEDVRRFTVAVLETYHPDAAYMYDQKGFIL